jgi:hypothetical protein
MAYPTLNVNLSGKNVVTEFSFQDIFNLSTKIEKTYSKIITDPEELVDFSDIVNMRYIIIQSASDVEINFVVSPTQTLKFVSKFIVLNTSSVFSGVLLTLSVKATTAALQNINVGIYGATLTV